MVYFGSRRLRGGSCHRGKLPSTATLRPLSQDRRPWLIAACSAALLAAVAVGTWQTVARREGTTTTAVEQTTAVTAPAQTTEVIR